MKIKTAKITLEAEDGKHWTMFLTFKELTSLVGGLTIVNDMSLGHSFSYVAEEDIADQFHMHLKAFYEVINPMEMQILLERLRSFVTDRGLVQ